MITEIGTLVTIVKGLIDITKTGGSLFTRGSNAQKQITDLQKRMEGLAEQLHRCAQLDRLIPAWEQRLRFLDKYRNLRSLKNEDATEISKELYDLMKGASKDYFSGAFFYTQYDIVPDVHREIGKFRNVIENIDKEISNIPPGGWAIHWPQLAGRLRDLENATKDVDKVLEDTLARLFKELKDASKV